MWLDVHLAKVGQRRWRAGIARQMNQTYYAYARYWWLALYRAWRKGGVRV